MHSVFLGSLLDRIVEIRNSASTGEIVQLRSAQRRAGIGTEPVCARSANEPLELGLESLDRANGRVKFVTAWIVSGTVSLGAWYGIIRLAVWIGSKLLHH